MDLSEQDFLELCKQQIEKKYHLGNGNAKMKQRDFEYLIDLIEEKSRTKLSISTLKRIWRNAEEQNPHPSTLNALVSILEYKDWLDFKLKNTPSPETNRVFNKAEGFITRKVVLLSLFIIALSLTSFFYLNKNNSEYPGADQVLFASTNTVSKGVPNTVIFNYDVGGIEADSFFIQQDWNPKHRDLINPEGEFFSSIYYVPGYHKAKLVANETFLKVIPIHIQTDGWMSAAFYNYDERPVYIDIDRSVSGILTANKDEILNSTLDIERFSELRFINIREYPGVDGHNFKVESRFRYGELLHDPCPNIQVTIHTEAHIYFVPLTLKGCESNLEIKIGEVYQSGRDHDLSSFGTDIFNWQQLELRVRNKTGVVFLNEKKVYEITFKDDFGDIKGLDFRSSGLAEIDYIKLLDLDDNTVYEDEFPEGGSN